MSFVARDSRLPVSNWVRCGSGWEKLIALRENLNRHIKRLARDRLSALNKTQDTNNSSGDEQADTKNKSNRIPVLDPYVPHACYIFIPRSCAKETAFYFTIGEVLNRLDFSGGIHDPKRFNYVCKILEIICDSCFSSLSGLAQKNFFFILKESVSVVTESKLFVNRIKNILMKASKALQKSHIFHVGSPKTWNKWLDLVNEWLRQLDTITYEPDEDDVQETLIDLPEDCLRNIMSSLSNHEDIVNLGATCKYLHMVSEENRRWEKLCHFHFTDEQIDKLVTKFYSDENEISWKGLYKKLFRRHGRRELYNNVLNLCNHCNCIYWKDGGHPCSAEVSPEFMNRKSSDVTVTCRILTPEEFMKLLPTP